MTGSVTKHEQRIKEIHEMLSEKYIDLETALRLVSDEYRRHVLDMQGIDTSGLDMDFEFVKEWGSYPKEGYEAIL